MALVAAVMVAPSPAKGDFESCFALGAPYGSLKAIDICLKDWDAIDEFGRPEIGTLSKVRFGRDATAESTLCKVTVRLNLRTSAGVTWTAGSDTQSCDDAVRYTGWKTKYHHALGTGATRAQLHGCVNLYYNYSSSSGWMNCADTDWHDFRV